MTWRGAAVLAVALVFGGCVRLPHYPPMDPGEALKTVEARDARVRSIMAPATLTLRNAEGSGISFDAAIVAQWPDRLRLRAWKFGAAAFDLTYTPEGLWVYLPDDARRRAGELGDFEVSAEQFGRVWRLMGPGSLQGAVATESPKILVARRTLESGGRVEFDIDRETLTIRECRFLDDAGVIRQTLALDSYRVFQDQSGDIIWPMRMTASGKQGRISIRFGTPEFNTPPPPEAFTPPRRATQQPERATD